MPINDLPVEIFAKILGEAAELNSKQGVAWTYGLGQADLPLQKVKLTRYPRGPVSADHRRWDSVSGLRQVCRLWHGWALQHAMESIYLRRWRGSERWAELSSKRKLYDIYELIEKPSGCAVYRDPYGELRQSADIFAHYPAITENIHRLWFGGFFTQEAEALIFRVLRSCRYLTNISVPWTILRHGSAQDWMHLLGIARSDDVPVESLELQAQCLNERLEKDPTMAIDRQPLLDPRVDFGHLKRLKLIGNTTFLPVNDQDLAHIARTATALEELHLTCLSTVSIRGVMDVINAAQSTIRVLEHSPRSNDGFSHPDPGSVGSDQHICETLVNCPKLQDVSISMPSVCPDLFSNKDVRWEGECQVRALRFCNPCTTQDAKAAELRHLLCKARSLMENQRRRLRPLDIELFFADCIFDPRDCVVHGDFSLPQLSSERTWSATKTSSSKGPYGSTGLYGKDEGDWEIVSEDEFFRAVERGWITI